MPGICGYISHSHDEPFSENTRRMNKLLLREPWHAAETFVKAPISLTAVSFNGEQRLAYHNGTVLAVSGEIANKEEFLKSYPIEFGENRIFLENLAIIYHSFGLEAFENLNGSYVIVIWEETSETLILFNGRLGNHKFYYAQQNGVFFFGSENKTFCAHPDFNRLLNFQAVVDIFYTGQPMNWLTHLEDVYFLEPASVIRYQNGSIQSRYYWDLNDVDYAPTSTTEIDYVQGYHDYIRQSVRRRADNGSIVFLTGGLDSRALSGIIREEFPEKNFSAVTLGAPKSPDVQFAMETARKLNFGHTHVPVRNDYIEKYAADSVWRTDGMQKAFECWIFAGNEILRNINPTSAILGLVGNTITGRFWPDKSLFYDLEELGKQIFKSRSPRELLENLFSPPYKDFYLNTENTLQRLYLEAPSEIPIRKYQYALIKNKLPRFVNSSDVLGDHVHVFEPFFDDDLVKFALSIPVEYQAHGRVFKKMIRKYIPLIQKTSYGIPHLSLNMMLLLDQYRLMKPLLNFRKRVVRRLRNPIGDSPYGYVFPNEAIRGDSKAYVMNNFAKKELYREFFNMDTVEKMLADHMSGRKNYYYPISVLHSFILWQEQFNNI